jgi:hypothetical protein
LAVHRLRRDVAVELRAVEIKFPKKLCRISGGSVI